MGKLLEELILQRLQTLLLRENGLSENQFGFRKGRSTVDAIQAVVNITINARKGTGKRKGFCALISIDIRNAFNTARSNICIEAMVQKKVPNYLLRMIDDSLSDKWSLKEEMTCVAQDVRILELRINERLWWAKRCLNSRGFKITPEKTEALLVTDSRSFQYYQVMETTGSQTAPKTGRARGLVSMGRAATRALWSRWDLTPQFFRPRLRPYSNANAKHAIIAAAATSGI